MLAPSFQVSRSRSACNVFFFFFIDNTRCEGRNIKIIVRGTYVYIYNNTFYISSFTVSIIKKKKTLQADRDRETRKRVSIVERF